MTAEYRRLKSVATEPPVYGMNVSASDYIRSGIRFLRTSDIVDGGEVSSVNPVYVDAKNVAPEHQLREGDLLISRSGTVGRSAVYRSAWGPCTYAGYLVRFRLRDDVDRKFMLYVTQSSQFLASIARGTVEATIGNFNAQRMSELSVPTPHLEDQRAIVRFLDKETERIDLLIDKRRTLMGRLASLVRIVVEEAVPKDAPRLALRRCVRRFVDYRGATPTKSPDGIPLITAANIKHGRLDFAGSREYVSPRAYKEWMQRGFPSPGDVIITTEAPLGEVAQIEDVPVALAQRVLLLQPNERVLPEYLKVYLLSPQAQQELRQRATGSTAVGIKASHLKSLPIVVPPLDVQRDVVAAVGRLWERYERSRSLIPSAVTKLKEYRTALITAAVTGQIDVRSAA